MPTILYTILTGLFLLLLAYFISNKKNKRFWDLMEAFHGGTALPLIGNALDFRNTEDFLWKMYEYSKNAGHSTYKLIVGTTAAVCLCDPDTIEVILSNNKELTKMTEYNYLNEWLGDGLLLSTGNKWRARRKIITPTFHFKILEQFVRIFNENGNVLIEQLAKHEGASFDVNPLINSYALDIICESAMGVRVNAQIDSSSEYVQSIHRMCRLTKGRQLSAIKELPFYYFLTGNYFLYNKSLKTVHKMTNNVIKTRRQVLREEIEKVRKGQSAVDHEDEFIKTRKKIAFLDLLLLSKLPDGSFLSDEDIREETDTFMFAGHDTTTSALSFALYSLANNPEIQRKTLEEVISIVGDDPDIEITYEHLQSMKYMEMVIKETLRLYPPVPMYGRTLENDLELQDGRIIPAGCKVAVDTFALGRNPRYYPDFLKFDPERFALENTSGKNPYLFVPFSAGSRNCIGQKFAMLEIKITLAKILLNYELLSGDNKTELRLASELTLKSLTGVPIIIQDRKRK